MKFVYLDKRDRVRAWSISRHPLILAGVLAIFLCLPILHESIPARFILEPQHSVKIRAMVPGMVTGVFADEGMTVASGAPLFRLRNLPLQSRLERSDADYTVATMRATSAVLHYSDIGASTQDRNRLVEQSRNLRTQAAALDVVSPMSGVVLTPRVTDWLSSYVSAGTELAEVADLSQLRARIYVSEYDLYKLKMGSPARLMVDGSLRKVNTVVASIAPKSSSIDPGLSEATQFKGLRPPNFYVVDMPVSNVDGRLRPGMVGLARIYGPRRSPIGLLWAEVKRSLVRKLW